jgi:hypothetical protein
MQLEDNPLLIPEDYAKGYRDSSEKLKNNPELVMFDKLCYELLSSEMGKKFLEYVEERYLIPSLANRESPNYGITVIWSEGFKDAFRLIKQCYQSHDQRIKAESNK